MGQEFESGLAEWSGWRSLMRLLSRHQPELRLCEVLSGAEGRTSMVDLSRGWQVCSGHWQEVSVPSHGSLFQGYVDTLTICQLASPRVGNLREIQWKCKNCFMI